MGLSEAFFLAIGVLVFSAGLSPLRAGDSYVPAESARPLSELRGAARPAVSSAGEIHFNVLGKPCLAFAAGSRPHLVDKTVYDYVVSVTNKCPRSIRLQICQKDRSGCSEAHVQAYRDKDIVMGFGPYTTVFDYLAKEAP